MEQRLRVACHGALEWRPSARSGGARHCQIRQMQNSDWTERARGEKKPSIPISSAGSGVKSATSAKGAAGAAIHSGKRLPASAGGEEGWDGTSSRWQVQARWGAAFPQQQDRDFWQTVREGDRVWSAHAREGTPPAMAIDAASHSVVTSFRDGQNADMASLGAFPPVSAVALQMSMPAWFMAEPVPVLP